jgi:hypothetical protein
MVDKAFLPDFSDYFKQEELSDVTVKLDEEQAAACSGSLSGEKRKAPEPEDEEQGNLQCITIPGHSMVLVAFSTFFKAKVGAAAPCAARLLCEPAQHAAYTAQNTAGETITEQQFLLPSKLVLASDRFINLAMSSRAVWLQLKSWTDGPFPKPEVRLLVPAGVW